METKPENPNMETTHDKARSVLRRAASVAKMQAALELLWRQEEARAALSPIETLEKE